MAQDYSDAKFGVNKIVATFPTSAAQNGTVSAATTIASKAVPYKTQVNKIAVRFPVGGTDSSKLQIVIGTATPFAAGTMGAVAAIGTLVVGTQANETDVIATISGTVQAGDCIILQTYGTTAAVYTIATDVWGNELFANT